MSAKGRERRTFFNILAKAERTRWVVTSFGTENQGFSIDAGRGSTHLSLRAWGFWNSDLCSVFEEEMLRAVSKFGGANWVLLFDALDFLPQTSDVFEQQKGVMQRLQTQGLTHIVAIVSSAITVLQIKRLSLATTGVKWTFCKNKKDAERTIDGI